MPGRSDLRQAPEHDGAVPRQRTGPGLPHRVRHMLTVAAPGVLTDELRVDARPLHRVALVHRGGPRT